MNKTIGTILSAAVFAVLAVSCQKEINEVDPVAEVKETIRISINGLMGEYTQVDATKSSLVNTVRVSWENGDIVYVYDGAQCLGSLVASLNGDEDRYALLSTAEGHTVTAPAAGTRLTLVHSPLLTEAPAVRGGAISISLAEQNDTKAPFVAYATLDYNGEESVNNAIVPFKFATSVIKVNCTGLLAGTAIDNATLSNVNTECKLTLSGTAAPTVAGDVIGTITGTGDAYFAAGKVNGEGEAVFQIAVPVLETTSNARVLTVTQGSFNFIDQNFTAKSLSEAISVNTVCQLIPLVRVERVSLDKTSLRLDLDEGTTATLAATVYPDNATDKNVTWSSSNEDVATVDAAGTVTTISAGTAIISVTTVDGQKTATCTVTVAEFQSGKFTINSDGNQVYFSPGNLWYDKSTDTFNFEAKQYSSASEWDENHVSHFFWSENVSVACAEVYADSEASDNDVFFTNSTEETASNRFAVNGIAGGYRVLSKEECDYLFTGRKVKNGTGEHYSYSLDITYGGKKGLVLYPDDYTGVEISGTVISLSEGVVFLPAAGDRDDYGLYSYGTLFSYWLSSSYNDIGAYCLSFYEGNYRADSTFRRIGMSVRLVTDVK